MNEFDAHEHMCLDRKTTDYGIADIASGFVW